MKYTGPSKPIPTGRSRWRVVAIELAVIIACVTVVALDVFVWRP